MNKIILIMGLLLMAAPVMGATPTPTVTPTVTPTPSVTPTVTPTPSVTPTPTSTPVPGVLPDWLDGSFTVHIAARFNDLTTGAITDSHLISLRTGESFVTPANRRLYITDINWSLQSAVIASLEWDGVYSDVEFDPMFAPFAGQGKVIHLEDERAITSYDPGISPVLTTDRPCTGWVFIGGYIE